MPRSSSSSRRCCSTRSTTAPPTSTSSLTRKPTASASGWTAPCAKSPHRRWRSRKKSLRASRSSRASISPRNASLRTDACVSSSPRAARSISGSAPCRRCTAKRSCCASSTPVARLSASTRSATSPNRKPCCSMLFSAPTAWFWSPARPVREKPSRSTPASTFSTSRGSTSRRLKTLPKSRFRESIRSTSTTAKA